jgi:alpha-L-rhamnosidase
MLAEDTPTNTTGASAGERALDLSPARWIWIGGTRALPNTVALFRRVVTVPRGVRRITGWITADSRYRLHVNGVRAGWGPAPCDPRVLELDPVDLTGHVRTGVNVLAVEVLFLGAGEGTYVAGRPGLLARLHLELADGTVRHLGTDDRWQARVDRSRPPGTPRRSYLRGWQEKTDLRRCDRTWATHPESLDWGAAVELDVPADRPPVHSDSADITGDVRLVETGRLIERPIPPLHEDEVIDAELVDSGAVDWATDPDDWFDFRTPAPPALQPGAEFADGRGLYATYRLDRQRVGWPRVELRGPAGTVVEVITAEGHDPDRTGWLDSGPFSWSRVVLDGHPTSYEPFEYECAQWIQVHVRNPSAGTAIDGVSWRNREYRWPVRPSVAVADPRLQAVFEATLNTVRNSAQDSVVDGMGRERQQYSGDASHQLHVTRLFFGAHDQSRRFLRTYARGMTRFGYFLDSWPGHDRVVRLGQREAGLTGWGSMIDHSIGFVFDCWNHYWETGDAVTPSALVPTLSRVVNYLAGWQNTHGLLPATGLGSPQVWMDHDAYATQEDKTLAVNLYAVAMLDAAYAPLAELAGAAGEAGRAGRLSADLRSEVTRRYWHPGLRVFVANRPTAASDADVRLDDRSLATTVLYRLAPDGDAGAAAEHLASPGAQVGLSYPANAVWRFRALIRAGRLQPVLDELRRRWAVLPAVRFNRTLPEMWNSRPDSTDQFSHCAAGPAVALLEGLLGYTVTAAGGRRCRVAPLPGDVTDAAATVASAAGPLGLRVRAGPRGRTLSLDLPDGLAVAGADEAGVDLRTEPTTRGRRAEFLISGSSDATRV